MPNALSSNKTLPINHKPNIKKCGLKTEVFSRCCGYYRPIKSWNRGKREEFIDRKTFIVNNLQTTC